MAERSTNDQPDNHMNGPQTNIIGSAQGPVLSGKFQGSVQIGNEIHYHLNSPNPISETDPPTLPRLFNVPELPPNFLPRPSDLQNIKDLLFGSNKATGITGTSSKLGVHGMGGIGKSVIAAAIAHESDIQKAFPDGIFWITIGSDPQLLLRQSDLADALVDFPHAFNDIEQGRSHLSRLLVNRTALIILDDVWQVDDAEAFNSLGPRCKMLITTRNTAIINGLGAKVHNLDILSRDEALKLLADWAGMAIDLMPPDAGDIVDECGHLPLAIAMIGAMLRGKPLDRWENALNKIRSADLDNIRYKFPKYPYPSLLKAIQVSIDSLKEEQQARYLDFAVFPEDTPIPEAVLQTFWIDDLDRNEIQDLVDLFVDRSLARRDKEGRLYLHDLQSDFVRKQASDLPSLHIRLLDSYRKKCMNYWPSGPNDGYFFQHLAYHMTKAGLTNDLDKLLLEFKWIQAKLEATNIIALLADYSFPQENENLRLIVKALRISSPVLAVDKNQLPSQLYGRLMAHDSSTIKKLISQIKPHKGKLWLRPLIPSLSHPGEPLLGILGKHNSSVTSIDVARNGQNEVAVSASADNTLKVWDINTGQLLKILEGHACRVNAVILTRDGRRAISASADGILRIWNPINGQPLMTFPRSKGHASNIRALALTRDDKKVISASEDGFLRIWDINTGEVLKILEGHTDLVSAVALTHDDQRAITASYDETIKIWDLETGHVLKTLEGHTGRINALALTSDDLIAVSGSKDKTLKIWDIEKGQLLKTLKGHNQIIQALALTHDDTRVISASADRTLKLWDIKTGEVLVSLKGHSDKVNAVAITHDDRFAVSGSADSSLIIWDLKTEDNQRIQECHSYCVNAIILTKDGRHAVSASNDKTIKIWDLETGQVLKTLEDHTARVNAVALSSDSQRLISASNDRRLRIWDFNSGKLLKTLKKHEDKVNIVVLTVDDRLAVSASIDRTLKVWDFNDGQLLHSLEGHTASISSVVLSADGRCAISASKDNTLRIWDLDHGKILKILEGHTDFVSAVVLTHDGLHAISASGDKTLKIWDIENGAAIKTLKGHTDKVNAIALTHDDKYAVSASADKTLKVWNLNTGQLQKTLVGHTGGVNAVELTSNDSLAVSASNDKTLKIWDIRTGKSILTFTAEGPVNTFSISSDCSTIIAGESVGRVHILRLENSD